MGADHHWRWSACWVGADQKLRWNVCCAGADLPWRWNVCVLGGCCSATESGFVCAVGADQATLVLNDCSAATRAILDA